MRGALLVLGTTSDAGKSTLVAGICRWLHRSNVRVAPFKAQNMSLNSAVTSDNKEIGRAQAMQAQAAGLEPTADMNPILLKPGSDRRSHIIVNGQSYAESDATGYQNHTDHLRSAAIAAFERLAEQYDVVIAEGAKMSKNKGNVVGADEVATRYGTDTARMFVLFAVPPEKEMDWTDAGAEGAVRFLGRVYRFVTRNADRRNGVATESTASDRKVLRKLHQTVKKITDDFESRWHFNTCIAAIMEYVNELHAHEAGLTGPVIAESLEKLTLLMAPFAPYLSQELWEELGHDGPVFKQSWPSYDSDLARDEEAEIVVQVNGKLRSRIGVPFGTSREDLETRARSDTKVQPYLEGKQVVKVIAVPDKLVNFVVK